MKKSGLWIAGTCVGTACLMMTGCQPKGQQQTEQAVAAPVEQKAVEAAAAAEKAVAEHPETAKPKDHPAH